MKPLPETFLPAASFDWDTLVPILFFVLYGIAQLFGAKKKRREAAEEEAADDGPEIDPAERARQIREEIRRKIEERRRAVEAQQGQPQGPPHRYDPTKPDGQQQRPLPAAPRTLQPQPQPQARPFAVPQAAEARRPEPAAPSFEERLREQRAQLEKARRQQQEAHERALRIEREAGVYALEPRKRKAGGTGDAGAGSADPLRVQVKDALMDPHGLRKAVLYREILGPPVGMR